MEGRGERGHVFVLLRGMEDAQAVAKVSVKSKQKAVLLIDRLVVVQTTAVFLQFPQLAFSARHRQVGKAPVLLAVLARFQIDGLARLSNGGAWRAWIPFFLHE